jgi:hypothetical protein
MKTLALYSDDEGEPQQCEITHDNTAQLDRVEVKLPNYNDGSTLFFIPLEDERPDVLDEMLEEILCNFIDVRA